MAFKKLYLKILRKLEIFTEIFFRKLEYIGIYREYRAQMKAMCLQLSAIAR